MSEKEMIKELKEHCDELELINQKVMEENEQLQQKWLESEYEKSKLVSQIDKMKCCYLCKNVNECAFADVFNFHCCDKWKLAELQKREL